jgi:beta-glucosidase-like glycosyl hydrolase
VIILETTNSSHVLTSLFFIRDEILTHLSGARHLSAQFHRTALLFFSPTFLTIFRNQVAQSRLDDIALRILAGWYFLGQDNSYPTVTGWSSWTTAASGAPSVQGTHTTVARAIARDGIVLLKNTNNSLPLKKPVSLAVVGYDAELNPQGANACVDRNCDAGTLAMVRIAF